ncbi:hypothetical protein Tco_0214795 [Tanacetum coccineum]
MHIGIDPFFLLENKTEIHRAWTINDDTSHLGHNGLTSRKISYPLCPCNISFASILPLVRLLLVLIVLGSVIQLPLVLSLAFGKSADLFVYTFLKLHYWTLTLEVSQTSTLTTGVSSLIPSSSRIPTLPGHVVNLLAIPALYSYIFHIVVTSHFLLVVLASLLPCILVVRNFSISLRCGDDEGSATANSVMHVSADGDCGVWH